MPQEQKPNWIYLLLYLIPLGTLCGNVFVCLAVWLERRLRNRFNLFLVSLAISDMLCALLVMPMSAYKMIHGQSPTHYACLFWFSMDIFFTATTILHLCTISLDRYLALRKPLAHGYPSTDGMGCGLCGKIAIPWLTSFFIAVPLFHIAIINTDSQQAKNQTQESNSYKGCGPNGKAFVIIAVAVTFFIPLFIMLATYLLTIHTLKTQMNQAKEARLYATSSIPETKATKSPTLSFTRKASEFRNTRRFSFRPSIMLRNSRQSNQKTTALNKSEDLAENENIDSTDTRKHPNPTMSRTHSSNPQITFTDCCEKKGLTKSRLTFQAAAHQIQIKNRAKREQKSFELWRLVKEYKEFLAKEDRKLALEWGSIDEDEISSSPKNGALTRKHSDSQITETRTIKTGSQQLRPSSEKISARPSLDGSAGQTTHQYKRNRSAHKNTIDRIHKGKRAMQVIGVLFGVFVSCYLPFFLLYILEHLCEQCKEHVAPWVPRIEWLGYMGSMLNPFVYHFFNPAFRRTFRKMMHCEYFIGRRKTNSDYRAVWRARV